MVSPADMADFSPTKKFSKLTMTGMGRTMFQPSQLSSKKTNRSTNKALVAPPPLLGPLEEVFHLLGELFHSRKYLTISKSVARGLLAIYQNLKIVRVHAIVQCQFANDLKIRLVSLKGQLENARINRLDQLDSRQKVTAKGLTSLPDPSLKKIIPVLDQTEKILSTLQLFMSKQPRLRLSMPPALTEELGKMQENLVRFPDHLSTQLNESKSLLQRIVVIYNQLAEAHKALQRDTEAGREKGEISSVTSIGLTKNC